MTRLTVPGVLDHEYRYTAGANNGRIYQRKDWVSGEEVSYQYDSLVRASGDRPLRPRADNAWDGVASPPEAGNLTAMPLVSGMTYDVENRLTQATHSVNGTDKYRYDPASRRVWHKQPGLSEVTVFYGLGGERMGRYAGTTSFSTWGQSVYFAGKLIWDAGEGTVTDRLGSVVSGGRKYFPYGEEPTTTGQNRTKFATYIRDTTTALDYADQRYYGRTMGRFLTPDPYYAPSSQTK